MVNAMVEENFCNLIGILKTYVVAVSVKFIFGSVSEEIIISTSSSFSRLVHWNTTAGYESVLSQVSFRLTSPSLKVTDFLAFCNHTSF